ncbi:MAG: alpha/beta hydrolase [Bacteroidota bacterium]
MFRVDTNTPFQGPHQTGDQRTRGERPDEAKAAVILVHGRGASAESILRLVEPLAIPGIYYVAPQATNNSWYPWSFLKPIEMNQPGLSSALQVVADLLSDLENRGIPAERVFLAGFSQGACLVSEFAARHPRRYGGVVALSGGLIGETLQPDAYRGDLKQTPIFLGCSDVDPHIPLERVEQSTIILKSLGADVDERIYPGMGHTVNREEMDLMESMIRQVVNKTDNGPDLADSME